jgi:hypothetical protein
LGSGTGMSVEVYGTRLLDQVVGAIKSMDPPVGPTCQVVVSCRLSDGHVDLTRQ